MFASHAFCRLARHAHGKQFNAVVGYCHRHLGGSRSFGRVRVGSIKSGQKSQETRIHVTISELCTVDQSDGIKKAMKLIKSAGSKKPDVALVGYLSVIDICLERRLINEALKAYKEIIKLGSVMEASMYEKFVRLAASECHLEAIDTVLSHRCGLPITSMMMAAVAEPLITKGHAEKYALYLSFYIYGRRRPKPIAVARVQNFFVAAVEKLPEAMQNCWSLERAWGIFEDYYRHEFPDHKVYRTNREETEGKTKAVDESDDDDDDEDEDESDSGEKYVPREAVNELNLTNSMSELDLDNFPEEFRVTENEEDEVPMAWYGEVTPLKKSKVEIYSRKMNFVPLPEEDLDPDEPLEAEQDDDDKLLAQLESLPDTFSVPLGDFEQDGKTVAVEMLMMKTDAPSSRSSLGGQAKSLDDYSWDDDEELEGFDEDEDDDSDGDNFVGSMDDDDEEDD